MPPLPELTGLPTWVSILAYVVLAVSIGVGGAFARFGFIKGKAGPSEPNAEIKAMAIDSRAVERLTGEISGLAIAVTGMSREIEESRREMRELGRAISTAKTK